MSKNNLKANAWTEEECEFLKKFYSSHGPLFCSNKLNRKKNAVSAKANDLGLKTDPKLTREKVELLTKSYLEYGIKYCIENFSFNGFSTKRQQETFFDFLNFTIDTPQKAWAMGFIFADAHLDKNTNEISIEISEHDMEDIKENFYHLTPHWHFSNRKRDNSNQRQSCLRISNYLFMDFLKRHGFQEKSGGSHDKIIKAIPEYLQNFFWLGLIDGDGTICLNKKDNSLRFSIWSNFDQDWGSLENVFKKTNLRYYISRNIRKNRPNQRWSVIGLSSKNETIEFLNYIYGKNHTSTIGLKRKFEKFQQGKNGKFDGPNKQVLLIDIISRKELIFKSLYEAVKFVNCDRGWLRKKCREQSIFRGYECYFKNKNEESPEPSRLQ